MLNVEQNLRERLTKVGIQLIDQGLTYGNSGNISAKIPGTNKCLIKPSGYSFSNLEPEDFILVNINTRDVLKGDKKPSIEAPFHTKLYALRPETGGIVHVHSKYCTILSIIRKNIVPMGYELFSAPALAKGVPISLYAHPGTEELANNLVISLKDYVACLIPHHGSITLGKSIEEAAQNARVLENIARLNYDVMLVGEPMSLPQSMLDKFMEIALNKELLM